jgi:hypothetical protein
MEAFAVWYYLLVVFPLALEALAGPLLLKQRGVAVLLMSLTVLWVAPVAFMHFVVGVPEIFHWLLPIDEKSLSPSAEALVCYALPVWLGFLTIVIAARLQLATTVQSLACAIVSAASFLLVTPQLLTGIVHLLTGR